jgi:hypothetical protein
VNWVLFQVTIAVLLDNFLAASNELKQEERLKAIQVSELQKQLKNPLDPLLLKLSKDYTNQAGLTDMLRNLFKVGQPTMKQNSLCGLPPVVRTSVGLTVYGRRCWIAITRGG